MPINPHMGRFGRECPRDQSVVINATAGHRQRPTLRRPTAPPGASCAELRPWNSRKAARAANTAAPPPAETQQHLVPTMVPSSLPRRGSACINLHRKGAKPAQKPGTENPVQRWKPQELRRKRGSLHFLASVCTEDQ